MWSPPRVIWRSQSESLLRVRKANGTEKPTTLGWVFPLRLGPGFEASLAGSREMRAWWPSSICLIAYSLSYLSFHQPHAFSTSLSRGGDNERCDRNVAAVQYSRPGVERIYVEWNIISSTKSDTM